MTHGPRRILAIALLAVATLALAPPAWAQSFPSKDIRFLNPFPAGGTSDLIGRILADQLGKQLGKPVIVENKTGANGSIAAAEVARAAGDGHTIVLASMGMLAVVPQMLTLSYNVDKDLTPITNAGAVYNLLVVGAKTPFKTWQEIAKAAKDSPEKHTCATVGAGSSQQLSCALFMSLTGTKLTQVPYRGGAPAILDIVGGRVDLMFGNMPEFMGQIRGGGLRPIAFGAAEASPLLPDVPVISKTGLGDFVIHNWFGVVGPGTLPPDLVKRWSDELNKALASAEVKQKFRDNGIQVLGGTPAQFQEQIKADRVKWGKVIKDHNIRPEN